MLIKVKNKDTLIFDDFIFRCSVGKKGVSISKRLLLMSFVSLNAIPKNIENTIIWSIFPSAIACIGFVGKISISTDFKLGASGAINCEFVIKFNPDPGERKIAIKSPREIASAVVNK